MPHRLNSLPVNELCSPGYIDGRVWGALQEDLGVVDLQADVSAALLDSELSAQACLLTRSEMVLCGCAWFERCFTLLGQVHCRWNYAEGELIAANSQLCELEGRARVLLSGERTALNFLQTMSATATQTHKLVSNCPGIRILDTRKTIPGLRLEQKYAVRVAGGSNQRLGLYDAYLLKENHLAVLGGISSAVTQARAQSQELALQVEVETLEQLQEALDCQVERIMLDNFTIEQISQAVAISAGRAELEVSGGVASIEQCQQLAQLGVNCVSIGALTKSVEAIDLSLRLLTA